MVERVVFPFRGAALGGSHIATFTLASAIQRQSTAECIILCSQDTAIMREAERLGLRTAASEELPTDHNSVATDVTRIAKRRRIMRRTCGSGRSIVHCNDVNTLRAWGLPARLNGVRVVYHHHALNRMWWPPHLVSLAYANAIVCVSEGTLASLRGWRRDATKELNPFEFNRSIGREAARASLLSEYGWPTDSIVVGWVGNFWRRKRPDFFLETAAILQQRDKRFRFAMFGRGGDFSLSEVRGMATERGMDGVIATPGFRQPAEANLAALDLLLAPAPREPFGRALVEAIVLGTPVVATRGAGHSEIIDTWGGGILANGDDTAADVADLCGAVLAAPARYRLVARRVDEIVDELSADTSARRMLALYGQLVATLKSHAMRTEAPAKTAILLGQRPEP
jgi:glycosyltransferase involved in cell wall biosynthesis